MDKTGDKIYELRKKQGLSQEQFAEKLNVSRQMVSQWENNVSKPKFDKIKLICKTFNIDTNYFMDEEISIEDCTANASEATSLPVQETTAEKNSMLVKKALLIILMVLSAVIFLTILSTILYLILGAVDFSNNYFEVITSHIAFVGDDVLYCSIVLIEIVMLILFIYAIKKYLKLAKIK